MERKKQVDKRIRSLFKLPENRYNLELLYKFLSQPSKGLCLCQVFPEERLKIFGFFKSDVFMARIHIINMVRPLCGVMDLQQIIIDNWEKFGPEKNIFFIHNIESAIYVSKTSPEKFFQELNLIRDFFMQFEAVFVFFVTESSVKRMVRNAFDFYDWMKFTFTFVSEHRDLFLQPIEIREVEGTKYSSPRNKIEYLERAIEKTASERDKSVLLFESGMLYRQVNDYDAALKRVLESLEIEEKYRDWNNAAKRYNEIAMVYQAKDDPDKALEFAVKASEIFENNHDAKGLAAAYNNIGRIYQDKGDPVRALEFAVKASEIFKKNNDTTGLAITYNNIGRIYRDKGDPDRALKSGFLMALDIFEKVNDTVNMAKDFNNIGLVYHAQGNSDKALEFFFKALEIFEKNNDRENLAVVYSNIGRIYQSRGYDTEVFYSEDNIDFVDLLFEKLQKVYPEEIIPARDSPGKEGEKVLF